MKQWKQVNPQGICEYTLGKDWYSISEEEANWVGSSPENSDLSVMNKISWIIYSTCWFSEKKGESPRSKENKDCCFYQSGSVHTTG